MDNLRGSTVLVIGGSGFLGRHLLTRLVRERANVHAISRRVSCEQRPVQWWQGSATDIDWIRGVVTDVKPNVIYQLSSASQGGQSSNFVLPTFENDLRTSVNALVVAQECGADRVILTRSLDERLPDEALAPQSPYAAAKAASGLYGRMFHDLYGVPVVMLRPFMTYGPGQKPYKVIPYTILTMLKGQKAELSSGSRLLDWIYVEDVISAFVASATRPEAIGKEIDIGTGSLLSVHDVVVEIQRLIAGAPAPEFGALPDRIREEVRSADVQGAEDFLGWQPVTSLREGLRMTIDWYRKSLTHEGLEDGESASMARHS